MCFFIFVVQCDTKKVMIIKDYMKRFILIFGIIFIMTFKGFADQHIKTPNVAGQFYTANSQELSSQIQSFLQSAPDPESGLFAEIIVAPHAGYVYSGQIAARAFKQAMGRKITTIIILECLITE